jgi:acyl carrier protein
VSITPDQARVLVEHAVRRIVPDADLSDLPPGTDLRRELELDSLDFLGLVEQLSQESGVRIDEDDYPALATLESSVSFLVERGR